MADTPSAAPKMTVIDAHGNKQSVSDTPANRDLATQNGMQIEGPGLISQGVDFYKGLTEGGVGYRGVKSIIDTGLDAAGIERHDHDAAPKDHSGKITVIDDSGGRKEVSDTPGNRAMVEQNGFKLEDSVDTRAHDILDNPQYQGARGAGNAFVRSAQNALFFDALEPAQKASMGEPEKRALDLLHEQNEGASFGGAAAGTVGNLLLPMPKIGVAAKAESMTAKAMAKIGLKEGGLATKIVSKAAKGGVEGAGYSAPHAIGQAVFDDPAAGGESMSLGVGAGAVLGGLGPLAEKFINVVKPYATSKAAEALEGSAGSRTMKMLGLERATMKKLGGEDEVQAIAKTLIDNGTIKAGMTREKMLAAVEEFGEANGKKVGEVLETLDSHIAAEAKQHADDAAARMKETMSGDPLSFDPYAPVSKPELAANAFRPGEVIKEINNQVVGNKVGPFYQQDMKMARDAMKQIVSSATGSEIKLKGPVEDQIKQLVAHADSLDAVSFKKGQELKKLFQPDFGKNPLTLTDKDHLTRKLYGLVTDEMNNAADRVISKIDRPDLAETYASAKNNYRAFRQTDQMRQNLMAKEEGNRFFSPSDHSFGHLGSMMGMGNAAEHGGSMIGGSIGGMLAGYALKRIGESTPFQTSLIAGANAAAKGLRALAAADVAGKVEKLTEALNQMSSHVEHAALNRNRKVVKPQISPISALMGGTETDNRKAWEQLDPKLAGLMNDPDKLQQHIISMGQTIADAGDPEASLPFMQTQMRVLDFINANKPQAKLNSAMFTKPLYRPSNAELATFAEKVAAASDPFYLTHKIQDGTLSQTHLDAVAATHPEILKLIQSQLQALGYQSQLDPKGLTLPYAARTRVSRAAGVPTAPKAIPGLANNPLAPPNPMKLSKPMQAIANVASSADRLASKKR